MELRFTDHPVWKKPLSDEEMVFLLENEPQMLQQLWEAHEGRIKAAEADPLNNGVELEHWGYAEDLLDSCLSIMCLGGNRCLAGEQEVYDPVAQKSRRVSEIDGDFHVEAIDTVTGERVVAPAKKPYRKPVAKLFDVHLSNSESFACSAEHRFATPFGWRSLSSSSIGQLVAFLPKGGNSFFSRLRARIASFFCRPQSNLERILLACLQDVLYWKQTIQDYLDDCFACYHQYDEQLRLVLGIGPAYLPLRVDAPRRKKYVFDHLDDVDNISQHSRLCLSSVLPSILCAPIRFLAHFSASLCRILLPAYSNPKSSIYNRSALQSCRRFLLGSCPRLLSRAILRGLLYLLSVASWCATKIGLVWIVKVCHKRSDVVWDFEVPDYYNYLIGNVPQKNSGKTEFGARSVVRAAIRNPNSVIVCFAQDEDASVRVQQSAVYRNLPPEYKRKAKTETEYINYKVKTGFSGASLILENGSQILFHKYSQFIANRAKFEGLELGSKEPTWHNIGLWLDEYLEDGDLVETMRFRLATRNSKMLMTFTPIDGFTPFVASYLKDVETIKTRPAELLDDEEVPLIQLSEKKNCGIVYFHSKLNPFGGYERIAKELKHSSREEILTRAYGIPVKSMNTLFPLFSSSVHVVSELPRITPRTHSVYHIVDPASARNYVSIWAAVDKDENVTILREWPDRKTYGPWAEFGDPKWKFGPASKKMGYNVEGYVNLFRDIEEELGVEVYERIGDSRFFASEDADNVDLFHSFSEYDMHFVPSSGQGEDMGISKLDDYFYYNANVEVDEANKPQITIHESCGNLIYSLINYGQNGKKDEPLKDFIDVARYLVMSNNGEGPQHYGGELIGFTRQGRGY